jgi:uncharacterized protein involved in exopolysaccharide biosynthesis
VNVSDSSNDVGLSELWLVVSRGRWLIAAMCLGFGGIAVTYALLAVPVYRAEVLVAPAHSESAGGGLSEIVSRFGGLAGIGALAGGSASAAKDESLAVLRSREFTSEFIQKNALMPILYAERWDASNSTWKTSRWSNSPTLNDAVERFDRDVRVVAEDRRTGMIRVSIEWRDRELAAQWANSLVASLNAAARRRSLTDSRAAIAFLRRELAEAETVSVRNAVNKLIEARLESIMLASVREDYALRVLDRAVVPDVDNFVRPKRAAVTLAGAFAGLFFGVLVVLLRSALRRRPT